MIIESQLTRSSAPPHRSVSPALPVLAMVLVAMTWGVTFSVVDIAAERMPPADLVAWRFGLATVALLLVRRRGPAMSAALRMRGILLGGLLGLGFLLQTWAMTDTDAMMAGFLIGTLVVMAPAIGWALSRLRPALSTWIGVAVATVGLALLSLSGAGFGRGEAITLLAAVVWALHLVLLARWGRPEHALGLARTQTTTVAGMALLTVALGGAMTGGPLLPAAPAEVGTFVGVLFLALPATAAAMIGLSWAQPRMSAARAAVILSLEPAAAAATAVVLGAELSARTVLGGVLMIGAMLIVELGRSGGHDDPFFPTEHVSPTRTGNGNSVGSTGDSDGSRIADSGALTAEENPVGKVAMYSSRLPVTLLAQCVRDHSSAWNLCRCCSSNAVAFSGEMSPSVT